MALKLKGCTAVLTLAFALTIVAGLGQTHRVSADGPGDWSTFHGDPARIGYNTAEKGLRPPLRLSWTYDAGGYVYQAPAVAGGLLYVGSYCCNLYALEAITGALKWTFPKVEVEMFGPTIADGVLYVPSIDGFLYALDPATGTVKWSYGPGAATYSSPAVADGVVYAAFGREVRAIDAASGTVRWMYQAGSLRSSPAVANGVVFVSANYGTGQNYGSLYALDAATGALKWTFAVGDYIWASPSVADGVVYIGSDDGRLYALDAATGALKWSYLTDGKVQSSAAIAEGAIYVAARRTSDGSIYALAAATGALRWSYKAGAGATPSDNIYSSPAVANGVVYVGGYDGKLIALDAQTGALLWSYATGRQIISSPAVFNGMVFVGSHDGYVYAFEGVPPSSSLQPFAPYTNSASFPISWAVPQTWTGTSAASYDLQYRDGPSGTWTDLLVATPLTSTTFTGQDGHSYSFRVRARTASGGTGEWSQPVSTTVDLSPPSGSVSINGGALYVTSMTATLYLSAMDGASGLEGMAFSNDGLTFSDWEPYAGSKTWTLGPGEGLKTVYARLRDRVGNVSPVYSDTITLDTAAPIAALGRLPAYQDSTSFPVSWSATSGSGTFDV